MSVTCVKKLGVYDMCDGYVRFVWICCEISGEALC